jgi:hypothetical protein
MCVGDSVHDTAQELGNLAGGPALLFPASSGLDVGNDPATIDSAQAWIDAWLQDWEPPFDG